MPARDQHRVLAVEADARAGSRLAVDVLVRVDEHSVGAAKPPAENIELPAELRVLVGPRVASEAALTGLERCLGPPVAARGRDDGARPRQERLRVTRRLRLRHRELHAGKEPARAPLADVALGLLVRLGTRHPELVEPEVGGNRPKIDRGHARIVRDEGDPHP